jgi:hypothetical protein
MEARKRRSGISDDNENRRRVAENWRPSFLDAFAPSVGKPRLLVITYFFPQSVTWED